MTAVDGCLPDDATVAHVWIPVETHDPPRVYDWLTELQSEHRCRMKGCRRRAVARFLRTNGWWRYCDQHLYGRRIVGTTIEHRVAVGSSAHRRFLGEDES